MGRIIRDLPLLLEVLVAVRVAPSLANVINLAFQLCMRVLWQESRVKSSLTLALTSANSRNIPERAIRKLEISCLAEFGSRLRKLSTSVVVVLALFSSMLKGVEAVARTLSLDRREILLGRT